MTPLACEPGSEVYCCIDQYLCVNLLRPHYLFHCWASGRGWNRGTWNPPCCVFQELCGSPEVCGPDWSAEDKTDRKAWSKSDLSEGRGLTRKWSVTQPPSPVCSCRCFRCWRTPHWPWWCMSHQPACCRRAARSEESSRKMTVRRMAMI